MIELDRHIEILLLDNDCVIVPGLGGFMAHREEARVDSSDNTFLPPLRTVGFNPKLTLNDSLLAQSYVEAYDISYPDAVMRIEDEVRELRQHLDREGSYHFNDLGVLTLNSYGNLEFEPCEAGILTPSLYGLSGFELLPLADLLKKDEEEKVESETEQLPSIVEEDIPDNDFVRLRKSWIRNIAVAVAAILAFLLLPMRLGNDRPGTVKGGIDTHLLMRVMPKDVTQGETHVKQAVLEAFKKQDLQKSTEKKQVVQSGYTIVLASRISSRNANDFVSKLHRSGYSDARIYKDKKGVKVIFGSYATKKEALSTLNKMNDNKEFADAWTMKYSFE
ncbi:MAG: SPOR domain-containing protein [Prevotella sp.]